MKNNKTAKFTPALIVCTDGSTLRAPFIYSREEISLNPDIKSSSPWLPESNNLELEGLAGRSTKFEKYQFNFGSLVKNN